MKVVLAVFQKEMKLFIRDRKGIVILCFIPFLIISFMVSAFSPYLFHSHYSKPISIVYIDEDHTIQTQLIGKQFEDLPYMKDFVQVIHMDLPKAQSMLKNNSIAGIIVIPKGFTKSIYTADNEPIILYANERQLELAEQIENQILSACHLLSTSQAAFITVRHEGLRMGMDYDEIDQVIKNMLPDFMLRVLKRNELYEMTTLSEIPNVRLPEYITAAMMVVILCFFSLRSTRTFLQEQELGFFQKWKTTPFSISQVMVGKFISNLFITFIQGCLILIFSKIIYQNYLPNEWWLLLSWLFCTTFVITCWSLLVSVASLYSQSFVLVGYLGSLLVAVVGGNVYPYYDLPDWVIHLRPFSFTYWSMDGLLKIFSGDTSLSTMIDLYSMIRMGIVLNVLTFFVLLFYWRK